MICAEQGCDGHLRVTHTYSVEQQKFQRAVCQRCGTIHCLTTVASPVLARGEGAKANAARAKKLAEPCAESSSPF